VPLSSSYVALQAQKNDDKQSCYSSSLCCGDNVCRSFVIHNDEEHQCGLTRAKERHVTTMNSSVAHH